MRWPRRSRGAPIDVLLNSAGTMGQGSFATEGLAFGRFGSSDFDDWGQVFRVNVMGPMKMAEAFVDHVAASEQKKIVALTSVIGSISRNTAGSLYAYRASKAALNAVMRSMSIDLRKTHGILAAPLHPGWVRTDMGGPRADIDAATSVAGIRNVIAGTRCRARRPLLDVRRQRAAVVTPEPGVPGPPDAVPATMQVAVLEGISRVRRLILRLRPV